MDYLNTWWIAQAHSECILHDSVIPTGDKPSPRAETVHGICLWSLYIYEWSITRCFHGQSANYDIGASTQNIPEDEDVLNKLTLTVKLFHDCKFAKSSLTLEIWVLEVFFTKSILLPKPLRYLEKDHTSWSPCKSEIVLQYWLNVGLPSATLPQH